MKGIKISDRTVRQLSVSSGSSLSFKEKIEVVKLLDKLNVDVIELDEIKNQRVDSLLIKSVVTAVNYSKIAVPVALGADPEMTAKALGEAAAYRLQVIAPVSSVRMEYVYHKKPAAITELVKNTIAACKKYTEDVEFIADDATRSDAPFLTEVINTAIEAGATTVTLCEDAGNMLPTEFGEFIRATLEATPAMKEISWGVSCCDELTMADACVIEAVALGADEIKAAAVPVNTASLENVARVIAGKGQVFDVHTGVHTPAIKRSVAQIQKLCAGASSVIEVVAENEAVEEVILSSHDDKEAVIKASEKLGYELSGEDADAVYEAFKVIANKKGKVTGKELDAIIAANAMQVPSRFKLDTFIVNSGNQMNAMVQVTLLDNDEEKVGISMGDGPIDASFRAIEQITGRHYELDDFQIRSVTEGKEATGEAVVKLRSDGKVCSGRGLSTDIIGASIRAYLNALNKVVYEEEA